MAQRLLGHRPSEVCVSSITLAELRYGARRRDCVRLDRLIDGFVDAIAVAAFDVAAADRFGPISAELSRRGTPIGGYDTLIAAHALALGATLVTNNMKHFKHVSGLKSESWA